ncbi:protein SspF [Sporosarcina sp. NCCP-2716]|uniref:small, acid-soluble spore protein, alpha/beta type n=1 Tax=Sporosarcina sp. NCCP-2716 TaxID=2943679 RepID=UPI00203BC57D|nr:small, acid-soluble spore protein, alpha/beta type [Sporosarcina sp. NCCP-2716]GKV70389.1 protein SspF [Sporosarcina sp. NCCP-2716]
MAKRNGVMSEQLKEEIAKELGFYDVVQREGWGGIKSRDAGNMVKRAIEMAGRGIADNERPH